MQALEVALGEAVVGVGDAAVLAAALRDGIDDDRVVAAVAAGIDQHRARQPQHGLQLLETRQRRIRRRVGAIRRVRIRSRRAENMAMRIAGPRRAADTRGVRVLGSGALQVGAIAMRFESLGSPVLC